MPLDFNVAEIATRLRRALTVRGRIPLTVDETVVSVVTGQNLDVSPFRATGRSFRVFRNQTPTVGQFAAVCFRNLGSKPIVIEDIWVYTGLALTITYGLGQLTSAIAQTGNGNTGELIGAAGIDSGLGNQIGVERSSVLQVNTADTVAAIPGQITAVDLAITTVNAQFVETKGVDITLQPSGNGIFTDYMIVSSTPTSPLAAGCRARCYE